MGIAFFFKLNHSSEAGKKNTTTPNSQAKLFFFSLLLFFFLFKGNYFQLSVVIVLGIYFSSTDIFLPTDLSITLLVFTYRAVVKKPTAACEKIFLWNVFPREKRGFGSILCQGYKASCCNSTQHWQLSTTQQPRCSAAARGCWASFFCVEKTQ